MKALTLTQPYAQLIALGHKRIETRAWRTPYRGPLAIHAALNLSPVGGVAGLQARCCTEPFETALRGPNRAHRLDPAFFATNLPRGCVVAVAELVAIHRTTGGGVAGLAPQPGADELAFGDYAPGRYAWLLADVRALPRPVPVPGGRGLWAVPDDVQAAIAEALAAPGYAAERAAAVGGG